MRLIHVVPLARGVFKEELTYFSSKKIEPGALVAAPIRGKRMPALVVGSEDAASMKSELRALPYQMKKIEETTDIFLFLPAFVRAAQETARYFATTTGAVIQAFTPKTILAESTSSRGERYTAPQTSSRRHKEDLINETYVFQADETERMSAYKSMIREQFARNASVFFCLPTTQDIERVTETLERGIKEYTYILHSGLSKKTLTARWHEALHNEHPVLIVATGSFLSLPRKDIKTLIVDREHAGSYKMIARPHVDTRTFAENFARAQNIRLIFGDVLLRPETLYRHSQGEFLEFAPLKFRSLGVARQELIDMRESSKDAQGEFVATSAKLHDLIRRTKESNEKLALLVARRGLSPLTVCGDCGAAVSCPICHTPLVLHTNEGEKKTYYMCHSCGRQESSELTCKECQGWRLKTLGVGIQRACKDIADVHPDITLFRLDSDTAPTPQKAREIIKKFMASPGSVLVGTEMMVNYLSQPIENTGVFSVDSLFTIPDYKINEKVFHLLLALRSKTQKMFFVQTRNPEEPVFSFMLQGNLLDFHRQELAARKKFAYPPFVTCIKLTLSGKRESVEAEMTKAEKLLAEYEPVRYPSFIEERRGIFREHMLLRLPSGTWIDEKLLAILRSLPPFFDIAIDPDSLL